MFIGIKPTLFKFAKRPEVASKLNEQRIRKDWPGIVRSVNERAVGKSEALEVKNKTLIVRVVNSLWLQEMFFYRNELDKKLYKYDKNISSIRFVI